MIAVNLQLNNYSNANSNSHRDIYLKTVTTDNSVRHSSLALVPLEQSKQKEIQLAKSSIDVNIILINHKRL